MEQTIEVTGQVWHRIFISTDFLKTEKLENAHKHYYYNKECGQRGISIINFNGKQSITQYYLIDINS